MPVINFIHPNGASERIEAGDGESAMLAATKHGLDGIVAECGGNAMCATCHVYVDEAWLARLPPMATTKMLCSTARPPSAARTAGCLARSS